jgi:hypothetical protein
MGLFEAGKSLGGFRGFFEFSISIVAGARKTKPPSLRDKDLVFYVWVMRLFTDSGG